MSRPTSPLQRPLDDGPRNGTEIWRVIDGVEFSHWDRWLLRLSLAEIGGLDALAAQFKQRRDNGSAFDNARNDGEAFLLQTRDLQRRLLAMKMTAGGMLDPTERHSDWLLKKAHKRVFQDGPSTKTAVMLATPQKVLRERAMRGHWQCLPMTPAPFAAALEAATDARYYDHRATRKFVSAVERVVAKATKHTGHAERLAVHRAALTVIIESMDKVDDSDADVAVMFRDVERAYHDDFLPFAGHAGLLRDFLELAIWEDYGLMNDVLAFLERLPVEHREPAYAELVEIIAELERDEVTYSLNKARQLAIELGGPG